MSSVSSATAGMNEQKPHKYLQARQPNSVSKCDAYRTVMCNPYQYAPYCHLSMMNHAVRTPPKNWATICKNVICSANIHNHSEHYYLPMLPSVQPSRCPVGAARGVRHYNRSTTHTFPENSDTPERMPMKWKKKQMRLRPSAALQQAQRSGAQMSEGTQRPWHLT